MKVTKLTKQILIYQNKENYYYIYDLSVVTQKKAAIINYFHFAILADRKMPGLYFILSINTIQS